MPKGLLDIVQFCVRDTRRWLSFCTTHAHSSCGGLFCRRDSGGNWGIFKSPTGRPASCCRHKANHCEIPAPDGTGRENTGGTRYQPARTNKNRGDISLPSFLFALPLLSALLIQMDKTMKLSVIDEKSFSMAGWIAGRETGLTRYVYSMARSWPASKSS